MAAFVSLASPDLSGNELKYLTECIETGYVTHNGRFEEAFEKAFSERFGAPAIATSSGTGALHLALLSLGVGPGDQVLIPCLAFGAVGSVVLACGATPVLVDNDPETWGIDKTKIYQHLTKRTRAIISVHNYGEDAGDFRQFGIPVIEDSCEALGMVPFRGKMACFSFYGNKVITTGEGGMLCGEFGNARQYRDGGFDQDYRNAIPGLNYRMSNLQAALGLAQIERLDSLLSDRLRNVELFHSRIGGRGKWLFCAQTHDPIGLGKYLKSHGVDTRPIFTPMHRSPAFKVYAKGKYKEADHIWESHLCLPTGPHVTPEQVEKISELIDGFGRNVLRTSVEHSRLPA